MAVRSIAATLLLATSAFARTDIAGCTYTDSVVPGNPAYATRIWYVPGTGELCEILDCGGGRAPPKTTVPGCPLYSGTATYSPSYIQFKTAEGQVAATASSAMDGATTSWAAATSNVMTLAPVVTTAPAIESRTANNTLAVTTTKGGNSTASASSSALKTSTPASGAMPTAAAVLGSCLIAGVAACVGMM